jgi:RNA polymerase sigma-70 factor (ECF subfamily)
MTEAGFDDGEIQRLADMVRRDDREAFGKLFAQHRPYMRKVVTLRMDRRLRARLDPSDVVQEAQLEAFRRLPDFLRRRPMSFRLWLRKTAQERLSKLRRLHLGTARRDVRREATSPDASSLMLARQLLARGLTPSQDAAGRERAQRIRQAVERDQAHGLATSSKNGLHCACHHYTHPRAGAPQPTLFPSPHSASNSVTKQGGQNHFFAESERQPSDGVPPVFLAT